MRLLNLLLLVLSISVLSTSSAWAYSIDDKHKSCLDEAQTTVAMVSCNEMAYKLWDSELNAVFRQLYSALPSRQKKALLASQQEWLQFRDKEFQFLNAYFARQGTIWSVIAGQPKIQLVKDRVLELRNYIDAVDLEGN